MILKPLANRVVIFPDPEVKEEVTKSGIVLPDSAKDKKPVIFGVVILIGAEVDLVKADDRVAFSEYGFDEVELPNGVKYLVGSQDNILAVVVED